MTPKKFSICLLCFTLFVILTACEKPVSSGMQSPVLLVKIREQETAENTFQYLAVYPNGKTAETDAFDPEDAVFYTAAHGDFVSSIQNKTVINTLNATTLIDESGTEAEADEVIAGMMQAAADSIEHDIWRFQAISAGTRYFAFVELNVNWQSPCILYEYNVEANHLTELCRWDGVDLIGISMPEMEKNGKAK